MPQIALTIREIDILISLLKQEQNIHPDNEYERLELHLKIARGDY